MRRKLSALLLILPLVGFMMACDDDDPTKPGSGPTVSIEILTPNNGEAVPAGPLFIQVRITGLTLDCNIGGPPVEGHGHWHAYVDGKYYGASCTDNQTIDISGLAPGKHALVASLRENDHEAYHNHGSEDPFEQLDTDSIISIVVE